MHEHLVRPKTYIWYLAILFIMNKEDRSNELRGRCAFCQNGVCQPLLWKEIYSNQYVMLFLVHYYIQFFFITILKFMTVITGGYFWLRTFVIPLDSQGQNQQRSPRESPCGGLGEKHSKV